VATNGDVDLLDSVAKGIAGKCLCALGEFSIMPVISGIELFRKEFDARIEGRS
jgi:NADH-quinone oxidoreductase subunit F